MKKEHMEIHLQADGTHGQSGTSKKSTGTEYQIAGTMDRIHRSYHPGQERPNKKHYTGSLC